MKNKISTALEKQFKKGELTYADLQVNLWNATAKLSEVAIEKETLNVKAKSFAVNKLSYSAYLFDNEIVVEEVKIKQPIIQYFKKATTDSSSSSTSAENNSAMKKTILVKHFSLEEGEFSMQNDSIKPLTVEKFNLEADSIQVNSTSIQKKIPFTYGKFQFSLNALSYELNDLEKLQLKKLNLTEKSLHATNFKMLPKQTKQNYVKVIPYEKDLMQLKVDSLTIENYNFSFKEEAPFFKSPLIQISGVDFNIYRDKTVKDDTRKKSLYSKMLRDLSLKLAVDSLQISRTNITYEELIKKDRAPGKVVFNNLSAAIKNVTNINLNRKDFPETNIDISTSFMGKSPLDVQWNFKVNDTTDYFTIKGSSFSIPPASINSFFKPAFNMKASGSGIEKVYFNFSGNNNQARGEVKLAYDKFKVEVLQKNGKKKNTILSWAANIIIKKKPKDGSVTKNIEGVKRDKTKSFWNYFWSCLQAGIKKSLI